MGNAQLEQMVKRMGKPSVYMLTGGFEHLVEKSGGELLGFTFRGYVGDCLLVIRSEYNEKKMVAFVGGVTAAGCLCAAEEKLRNGGLKWRPDRYAESE